MKKNRFLHSVKEQFTETKNPTSKLSRDLTWENIEKKPEYFEQVKSISKLHELLEASASAQYITIEAVEKNQPKIETLYDIEELLEQKITKRLGLEIAACNEAQKDAIREQAMFSNKSILKMSNYDAVVRDQVLMEALEKEFKEKFKGLETPLQNMFQYLKDNQ